MVPAHGVLVNKDYAKERAKQIEAEKKKLKTIGVPFQILFFGMLIVNFLQDKAELPAFFGNQYLIYGLLIVAVVGFVWVHTKIWKLDREQDDLLSRNELG